MQQTNALFFFFSFFLDSKMLGSIVTDLEVDALTNVVAKLKIEVCSLTAWCLLSLTVLVATSNFN